MWDFDGKVVQHLVELVKVSHRGQAGAGRGGVFDVFHEVEVAANEGGEPSRDLGHGVHQRALASHLVSASEKVAVEEQESLPGAVHRNILATLHVALTKRQRNVDRLVVVSMIIVPATLRAMLLKETTHPGREERQSRSRRARLVSWRQIVSEVATKSAIAL